MKDTVSKNNAEFQAIITKLPNLIVINGVEAKTNESLTYYFLSLKVHQDHNLQKNQIVEANSRFIAEISSII